MLIYILDPLNLTKIGVIEEYQSCLWVERFIDPGEVKIVMGATHDNAVKLRPGTVVLHEDSDEPMLLETREIKDGQITAAGKTIEAFFNERYVGPLGRGGLPSNIIRYVVYNMQNRQSGKYAIPNLRPQNFIPDIVTMGHEEHIFGFEKAHDALIRLAQKYSLGIAVKRQFDEVSGLWELVFVVRDTTMRIEGTDYLRLSPNDDTFVGIDEMYSIVDQVDVVLVHAPKAFAKEPDGIAVGWWPMSYPDKVAQGGPNNFTINPSDNPFDWRIVEIPSDDLTQDVIDKRITDYWWAEMGYPPTWAEMTDAQKEAVIRGEMRAKAKDEWHKSQAHRKIAFDGQIPGEILKYGRDYHLGDIIIAEGNFTGGKQSMMVSEYIRSSDGTGARSYPTLVQPLDTYEPDTTTSGG